MGGLAYIGYAWTRRELLRQLAWREVKAGRRQSALGVAWMLLQPLAYLLVLSVVFAFIRRLDALDVPYPLFLITGLVPSLFVTGAVRAAVGSVVDMAQLVRKVAFPRIFCPMSVMAAHVVNLVVSLALLFGMLAVYGVPVGAKALWVVPALAVAAATALGLGFLLAALNVYTRDTQSATPLLVQVWFFATPVVYPLGLVKDALSRHGLLELYMLNPLVGAVETMRYAVLDLAGPPEGLGTAAAVSAVTLVAGAGIFTRLEKNFADVI